MKIGLLGLVSCILFVIVIMLISGVSLTPRREVRVDFGYINSLETGAPVRYAGAKVGQVGHLHILTAAERAAYPSNAPAVYVYASVDKSLDITKGSRGLVNTMGFMGEKYLEITANTKSTVYIGDNEPLQGVDPTPLDTVLASAKELADEMKTTAEHMDRAVVDLEKRLPQIHSELDKTLGSARQFTDDADEVLLANREDLRHLIANGRQTTIYMKSMSHVLATRPWKLVWGFFSGPIPIEPESERYTPPPKKQDKKQAKPKPASTKPKDRNKEYIH